MIMDGFRVGNIVRLNLEYYKYDNTFVVNKIVARNNKIVYGLISQKDGSQCYWWDKEELTFIEEGEPILVEELKKKRKECLRKYKDLNWIKSNWNPDSIELNLYSILTLFYEIGYLSSASGLDNKWIVIWSEWEDLYPVFKALFKNDLKNVKKPLKELFSFRLRRRLYKNCKKLNRKIFKKVSKSY